MGSKLTFNFHFPRCFWTAADSAPGMNHAYLEPSWASASITSIAILSLISSDNVGCCRPECQIEPRLLWSPDIIDILADILTDMFNDTLIEFLYFTLQSRSSLRFTEFAGSFSPLHSFQSDSEYKSLESISVFNDLFSGIHTLSHSSRSPSVYRDVLQCVYYTLLLYTLYSSESERRMGNPPDSSDW